MVQFKEIAAALRMQLEQAQFGKDQALRTQQTEMQGEIRQLRETIAAMRQAMEHRGA